MSHCRAGSDLSRGMGFRFCMTLTINVASTVWQIKSTSNEKWIFTNATSLNPYSSWTWGLVYHGSYWGACSPIIYIATKSISTTNPRCAIISWFGCVWLCYCSVFPWLSTLITLTLQAFIVTMYASHVTINLNWFLSLFCSCILRSVRLISL